MNIEVYTPTWASDYRWVIALSGITDEKNKEIIAWCDQQGMEYKQVAFTYWVEDEKSVNWFILRWS